jgi:predicted dehydrogenase
MKRRQFCLASAAALASPAALPLFARSAHSFDETKPLRVGLVGSGWYGKVDLFRLLQVNDAEVIALCDVDRKMLEEAGKLTAERQKSGKVPVLFEDYRKMLAAEPYDIVIVGTPDHWHALPTIAACKAGADVYCQKPTSVDVIEGDAMVAAARKYDRVVQVGTQRRSTPHLLEARDKFIDTGKLGSIGFVEIYSYFGGRHALNPAVSKPPEWLDYDLWTGPAPMRPFIPGLHPVRWRAFMEYGNGQIGDLCVHFLDLVRYFLKLGWPKRVSSNGGILVDKDNPSNIPDTQSATFEYDDLLIQWTNRCWGLPEEKDYPWAVSLFGDKGTLKMNLSQYEFEPFGNGKTERGTFLKEPATKLEKQEQRFDAKSNPATRRHMQNFIECIKTRERPVADIEEGHISSASCILANVAMELGRTLNIDTKTGHPIDDAEATKRLARPYREPWIHPTAGNV